MDQHKHKWTLDRDAHGQFSRCAISDCPARLYQECRQWRRVYATIAWVSLTTGARRDERQEWRTKPCGVPLWSEEEKARGTCRGCAAGWTHEHNLPVDPDVDPVAALLAGRHHYRRRVAEPRGEPELQEVLAEIAASCEAPMEPVESQDGRIIGYRCPRCQATATADGRTEHGPHEIHTIGQGRETRLVEPEAAAAPPT